MQAGRNGVLSAIARPLCAALHPSGDGPPLAGPDALQNPHLARRHPAPPQVRLEGATPKATGTLNLLSLRLLLLSSSMELDDIADMSQG